MKNWKALKEVLGTKQRAIILSHRSPDGDSIGSSLALYHYLKTIVEEVIVITPDPAPQFLAWIKGFEGIVNYENHRETVTEYVHNADLICCLDFNALHRMGELANVVKENKEAYILNIDHHQDPEDFADFQFSDVTASSTAQLIYDTIDYLGDLDSISIEMAEAIYTGILTDTGSFRFSSTSEHTHEIAARLMKIGIQPSKIHQRVYDNYSMDRIKLLGFALNERFNTYPDYSTGIIYLKEEDLKRFNFKKGDTEGIVNYPLSVGTIKMAILITEKDGKVKMSFRSKDDFHVNKLAAKYFSGGGHLNAAGGISDLGVEETVKKIESILPEYETELNA